MVTRPPTTLAATSWDRRAEALVAAGGPFTVHSVFERALNLATPSDDLLGLVGPRAGNGPATIVLQALPHDGFGRLGIFPGLPASARPTRLEVAGVLGVDLSRARSWSPPLIRLTLSADEALARLARAERAAETAAPAGGLAGLLPHLDGLVDGDGPPPAALDAVSRVAWRALILLLPAWARDDRDAVMSAAGRLAGLGPGLTPSGDDLLAGLLVATPRIRGAPSTTLAEACLATARDRTTDIALARIRHAAEDAIEEVQETVLTNLLTRDDYRLEPAVERAARWGHTSGVDTLVGIFLGIRLGLTRTGGHPRGGAPA